MKILQFGFEDVSGKSLDSPHYCIPHSIVYTGTHDNDVTNGWYNGLTLLQLLANSGQPFSYLWRA